ncbi:MAG TPA: hypothetical protein DD456_12155 [Stenotrophomonas sp.]|nr:hypothetical protein [Stenotrophomonas sp.]
MTPDASKHDPRPEYIRALLQQAGVSQRQAATLLGISERMMRYYLAGERPGPSGQAVPCLAPYTVQYALEALAHRP